MPEPPSLFEREYARVELDSEKEIKRQEEEEGKKDEFDEDEAGRGGTTRSGARARSEGRRIGSKCSIESTVAAAVTSES